MDSPPAHSQHTQSSRKPLPVRSGGPASDRNKPRDPSRASEDLVAGRIRVNRQGKGFVQPDNPALPEIAIDAHATATARHEDRVLVRRDERRRRPGAGNASSGKVVRVLERRRKQLVGTLERGRRCLFVIPDDPRVPHDIIVPEPRDVGRPARVGDKVVVELEVWDSANTAPEGEIVEVLGAPDAEGVDMLSVLRQYDLPLEFPRPVLQEARALPSVAREFSGRLDCRSHNVVTIDPDDAKDFDDAICLERVAGSRWRLWVHIADVSHYVKPGSALDREARQRGNSTYLVDRVIPMLPEALSNELCSLKPGVDRLTKAVEFLIADDGRVLGAKFHSAVIHSRRRFTYAEALGVLRAPIAEGSTPIERMLHDAHELAQRIRRRRFQAGSLDLDFPETKIRLDERGRVARIEQTENDESHQLIEEFMLLANEAVAGELMRRRQPAVYRVHELPEERRLEEYRQEVLSHGIPCGDLQKPGEAGRLLARLKDHPIGPALKIGFLKSLMRARYAVEPLGHYGLAKAKYTHFTSPIRRYADLVVHRALFHSVPLPNLKETAEHLSLTERNSADAERDSKDVKLFAFLNAQLQSGRPEHYAALVIETRHFGFFVDVPGLAMSGLVPLSTIQNDTFGYDAARNLLTGRRTRRTIRVGDAITVQVAKVDRAKRQVDFRLALGEEASSAVARRPRQRTGADARAPRGNAERDRRPRQASPVTGRAPYKPRRGEHEDRPKRDARERTPGSESQPRPLRRGERARESRRLQGRDLAPGDDQHRRSQRGGGRQESRDGNPRPRNGASARSPLTDSRAGRRPFGSQSAAGQPPRSERFERRSRPTSKAWRDPAPSDATRGRNATGSESRRTSARDRNRAPMAPAFKERRPRGR